MINLDKLVYGLIKSELMEDFAPIILDIMEIHKSKEMTGNSIIERSTN